MFGDKRPRNGSKNGEMAPRTGTGYPHIGVCVGKAGRIGSAVRIQRLRFRIRAEGLVRR